MNASSRLLRPIPKAPCQLCESVLAQPARHQRFFSSAFAARPQLRAHQPQPHRTRQFPRNITAKTVPRRPRVNHIPTPVDPAHEADKAEGAVNAIIASDSSVPSEEKILKALDVCEESAAYLAQLSSKKPKTKQGSGGNTSPASMLLGLDPQSTSASLEKPIEQVSTCAYHLMLHPTVFITPKVLNAYVNIQLLLRRPDSLPEILYLYANKPVPSPGSSPVTYKVPNPKKVMAAVPREIANRALEAAMEAKDLHLALSVIELTFRQPAYSKAKVLNKVLLPGMGLSLAPVAAYILASKFAEYQQVVDAGTATTTALAGILTYVGAVTTVGVVAVTTANDHMDRVTWAPGMALTERWLREEERAAVDMVAQAWGFKEDLRRGEEEGEEWDELREWVGLRGMVLDKVDLMEGMQ
ncbi:uncharacterized protein K452DRAFT_283736 [Aplosporella prunicola CBS 121167]|uniref:Uncharacterized protein n=1 Tax=Aplosporella prunicola CBS 121167 TaxID=1176127 RepID=A0A6A6BQ11_9PEZI|nr:uncharacterized protein K452DRAFT_283736 [Aplosporella prunicola CBS 121167]KAF2145375.1 hypothetical protein K452DRAFT_283736 [Aplosporella prunicola CBS 121167]